MTKDRRSEFLLAIQAAGLDPGQFEWEGDLGQSPLRHVPSQAYFLFDGPPGLDRFSGTYRAGDYPEWSYEADSWEVFKGRAVHWLTHVKGDLEMPDLWAELQQEQELFGDPVDEAVENTPFNQGELAEIAKQLREIQERVRTTYPLSANELTALDQSRQYLEDAAGRGVGRTDWRNILVGTMVQLFVSALLPREVVRTVLVMALHGLGHLLGGGGTPLFPGVPDELPPV